MFHDKVREFHTAFSHPIGTEEKFPPEKLRQLRINLIKEEVTEFFDAHKDEDMIEMADALADIAYVVCGAQIVYGSIEPTYSKEYVFKNKMDPMIKSSAVHKKAYSMLSKAYGDYKLAETNDNYVMVKHALEHLLDTVIKISELYYIPLDKVFLEVHLSNMSKLDENGKPIYREDGKILKSVNYFRPDIKKILYC